MINYKEIIDNLTDDKIIELLEKLDIPYQNKDDYILCKTACHNVDLDEASWKLYYYKDNHIFYCYTSCESMSIFKFLKNYYETRQIDYNWYNDIYQLVKDCSNTTIQHGFQPDNLYRKLKEKYTYNNIKELEIYPKGLMDVFNEYYPVEWLNDGISKATMKEFGIKFSTSQNKIIIPHYNINNDLVGIRGRALNEWEIENVGKYLPVQIENKWYSHPLSLNLYGLNKTKENIKRYGICFVGESEKFVLQMNDFKTLPNCAAAVCGSQFNKYQLNILMKHCQPKEIVICFDNEEKTGQHIYFNKLYNICQKYKNYCNMSFIYDRENLLELKDSPTDKGERIFQKLIERRIKVK